MGGWSCGILAKAWGVPCLPISFKVGFGGIFGGVGGVLGGSRWILERCWGILGGFGVILA